MLVTILGLAFGARESAAYGDESVCLPEKAVAVGFHELQHNPDRYLNKCIKVHGILAFRGLHADLLSLYTPLDSEIAVYANEEDEKRLWAERSEVELTGLATKCETIDAQAQAEQEKASAPPGQEVIVMVTGLCHYQMGAVLLVSSINWLSNGKIRLTGETNRSRYGDLTKILASSWRVKAVRSTMEAWFTAARQRDWTTMFKSKGEWPEEKRKELMDMQTSPLLRLFGSGKPLEIAYFQTADWLHDLPDSRTTYACVCTIDTCDGKWPISEIDVWPNPAWPYYCVGSSPNSPIQAL
ncbi:MAG TPA: hypothetical protein VGG10_08430 [Rhizomicrobium sp.]